MDTIPFTSNLGPESLSNEYKQFTLNAAHHNIDITLAEELVTTNEFCFGKIVKEQIVSYLETFVPKFVSAIMNPYSLVSKGNMYIGVEDNGTVIGIPFQGTLNKYWLDEQVHRVLRDRLSANTIIDLRKYVRVRLLNVNNIKQPKTNLNDKVRLYFKEKADIEEKFKKYLYKLSNWKRRLDYFNQKLVDLANNPDCRINLISYIKSNDPTNKAINILESDWLMESKTHDEISILKVDKHSPYYWVVTWKDMMIDLIKKSKPHYYETYNMSNHPINLIKSVSEMVPYWIHYNTNMNLYVIQISVIQPINKTIVSYQEPMTGKWLRVYRTEHYGEPACIRF